MTGAAQKGGEIAVGMHRLSGKPLTVKQGLEKGEDAEAEIHRLQCHDGGEVPRGGSGGNVRPKAPGYGMKVSPIAAGEKPAAGRGTGMREWEGGIGGSEGVGVAAVSEFPCLHGMGRDDRVESVDGPGSEIAAGESQLRRRAHPGEANAQSPPGFGGVIGAG